MAISLLFSTREQKATNQKIPLKKLVLESQTPGGTNEFVLKKLKKTKFYNIQQKVLNSIFKKF